VVSTEDHRGNHRWRAWTKIHVHVQRYPLARVADVYERLRGGQIDGRAVVCP
jgi:D-arabinose 1-dehydrogenase-like Zn-dependent alcohol dehydrogenase